MVYEEKQTIKQQGSVVPGNQDIGVWYKVISGVTTIGAIVGLAWGNLRGRIKAVEVSTTTHTKRLNRHSDKIDTLGLQNVAIQTKLDSLIDMCSEIKENQKK